MLHFRIPCHHGTLSVEELFYKLVCRRLNARPLISRINVWENVLTNYRPALHLMKVRCSFFLKLEIRQREGYYWSRRVFSTLSLIRALSRSQSIIYSRTHELRALRIFLHGKHARQWSVSGFSLSICICSQGRACKAKFTLYVHEASAKSGSIFKSRNGQATCSACLNHHEAEKAQRRRRIDSACSLQSLGA